MNKKSSAGGALICYVLKCLPQYTCVCVCNIYNVRACILLSIEFRD